MKNLLHVIHPSGLNVTRKLKGDPVFLDADRLRAAIRESKGRIFTITFLKRDGTMRDMLARTGVTYKSRGGNPRNYNPADHGLITLYDMQKRGFRSANLQTTVACSLLRD